LNYLGKINMSSSVRNEIEFLGLHRCSSDSRWTVSPCVKGSLPFSLKFPPVHLALQPPCLWGQYSLGGKGRG